MFLLPGFISRLYIRCIKHSSYVVHPPRSFPYELKNILELWPRKKSRGAPKSTLKSAHSGESRRSEESGRGKGVHRLTVESRGPRAVRPLRRFVPFDTLTETSHDRLPSARSRGRFTIKSSHLIMCPSLSLFHVLAIQTALQPLS